MLNRDSEFLIYAFGMAVCFGLAGDAATNGGQLTWRWPLLSMLFLAGFWYSYTGGKIK